MRSSSEAVEVEVEVASLVGEASVGSMTVSAGRTVWPSIMRLTRLLRRWRGESLWRNDDLLTTDRLTFLRASASASASAAVECESQGSLRDLRVSLDFSAGLDGRAASGSVGAGCFSLEGSWGVWRASSSGRKTGVTRP